MENKKKENVKELDNEALENVNGGAYEDLMKPIIVDEGVFACKRCGRKFEQSKGEWINGKFYCLNCKDKI